MQHLPDSPAAAGPDASDDVFVLPQSHQQQRLWQIHQVRPGAAYNVPAAFHIRGALDVQALQAALDAVVRRHESLRTGLSSIDGELVQVISPSARVSIEVDDAADAGADAIAAWATRWAGAALTLADGPLLRVRVLRLGPDQHVLLAVVHHGVVDGASLAIVLREWQQAYAAVMEGRRVDLGDPSLQYADFVLWDRQRLAPDALAAGLDFWRGHLAGAPVVLDLPVDRPRPAEMAFRGGVEPVGIDATVAAAVRDVAGAAGGTLYMAMLAAFAALLSRYTGQRDVVVGTPVANRPRPELEGAVGFFANTVALRLDLGGEPTFRAVVRRVRDVLLGALPHGHVPFDKVVEAVNPPRSLSHNPLFQALLGFQQAGEPFALRGADVRPLLVDTGAAKVDVSLDLHESPAGVHGSLEFNTELFERRTAQRMARAFARLLAEAAAAPDVSIERLPLAEPEEVALVRSWNVRARRVTPTATVAELVAAQASRSPDAVAVSSGATRIRYAALDAAANRLARHLGRRGVGRGTPVGVLLDRTVRLPEVLLAILKAGGAYVPLDPGLPDERLQYVAADAGVAVVVTTAPHRARLAQVPVAVDVTGDAHEIDACDPSPPAAAAGPDDLAYVLYTSGSTGRPKGVAVPHRALTNLLCSLAQEPGCAATDVMLAITTLSFDIAAVEMFLPLVTGGRVEVASRDVALDGRQLAALIDAVRPSIVQGTPATWRMLLDAGWRGHAGLVAFCGGEPLAPDLAARLLACTAALWNMYGPTETTVYSSIDRVTRADDITIGRAVANTALFVLDAHLQPLPLGVPGELCIGGAGVAAGYVGRPDLTAERFVTPPWPERPPRLYRTGDRAKFLPDGRVVHLGRLDTQVKIRGFRVELGEIEAALQAHAGVRQAVAAVHDLAPGDRVLVGYVVASQPVAADALRQHLARTLPAYMVPALYVPLTELPLTPSGKIDRARLPAPARGTAAAHVAPRDEAERRLAEIWSDVLGVPAVSVVDDFFALGGHSLLAVRLVTRAGAAFAMDVPLHVLFEAPTVERMARWLHRRQTPAAAVGEIKGPLADTTAARLVAIWEDVLQVRPIGTRDRFPHLDVGHPLFERMLAAVRQAFGMYTEGLPIAAFAEDPTVEGLARLIHATYETPPSLVVCLQPKGSQPLFLLHAGRGYVFFYRALAALLAPDTPVYAIRAATAADRSEVPFDQSASLGALAARYLREVRTVQPHGPYRLGGACLGGVLAFEMANQLRDAGEDLAAPLLLFDSFVANNPYVPAALAERALIELGHMEERGPTAHLWRRARRHLAEARTRGARSGAAYLGGKAANVWRDVAAVTRAGVRRRLEGGATIRAAAEDPLGDEVARFSRHTARLLFEYVPRRSDHPVAFFRPATGDAHERWRGLTTGPMVVHDMPGTHLEMLEEPHVVHTARLVRACLQAAADERTSPDVGR